MTYILTYMCVCTIQFKPIQCNSGQLNPIQFLLVVTCVSLFSFISTVVVYQVINSLLTLSRRVRCKCWGDDFTTCTYRVDAFHIILRLGIQYRTNTGIEPVSRTMPYSQTKRIPMNGLWPHEGPYGPTRAHIFFKHRPPMFSTTLSKYTYGGCHYLLVVILFHICLYGFVVLIMLLGCSLYSIF
jgi:hypothetical protein